MSETPKDPSPSNSDAEPSAKEVAAPLPEVEPVTHTPVQRMDPRKGAPRAGKMVDTRPAEERRDFFSEAMREALIPLSGILERKINPILAALEAIPDDVERLTHQLPKISRALDQPQSGAKSWPLKVAEKPAVPERILRPPGAIPGDFESRCSRCGKCVEACPANAIQLDFTHLPSQGMPRVIPKTQPCVVCDSLACMSACPTTALKVTERLKIKMGTAKVNLDLCLRENGEECRLCLEICPIMGAEAGEHGDALAIHAESGRVRVRRNACVGCGLCENRCPTEPAAIVVEPYRLPVDPMIA